VLQGRELDYVAAARALGASDMRILFVHILPAVVPFIVVAATLSLAGAIIAESSLSFLGFGVRIPTATWGNMMTSAQSLHTIRNELWLWLSPGVAIAATVIAVNFLGDGLRDALDPRQET
jgi:peptide/nickel transport system permease protein